MQDKAAIPYQHWSLKVGRMNASTRVIAPHFGEIVWGVNDLHQSISSLVLSPLGSCPTEPEKGCDLLPWIDRSLDIAVPNVTRVIWDALTIWEPRIVLQDIKVFEVAFGHLSAEIYWRPAQSVLDEIIITQVANLNQAISDRRVA